MDVQVIDQAYTQLQSQAQQTVQALQTLGNKLQAAANGGDSQAREWMLDLRELALTFQAEQQQVGALLQALHAGIAQQQAAAPTFDAAPAPAPQQGGGFFGSLLSSGFGQAVAAGAGFGIGNDIIKDIF
ncbi:hypothetical protein AA103196_2563 [Ameyamaea chiangmaiensis NBRC 103196]|uniref:Uncharacterized protein n=1 Tax=Ameyamaea chiangmaiensis TaxID=442969 RepID=A0A850PFS4_9PROT|nr:hypothetical protein [Ameyamaea chiangmaiensis]MBS4075635.1 hypothetical protein [Ameyamaea chiangmaiensis]NVN41489.1 hypothetical protein [Ameyamaea chiangmaiensis]GBQ70686.1 hypothetical protein AA103196_2563 [Ameyamaea chiangmaiensis NBRC 103196]